MSVKKCKVCGRTITKKATSCYNCGARIIKKKWPIPEVLTVLVLVYAVVYFSDDIMTLFDSNSNDTIINDIEIDIDWNDKGSSKLMNADVSLKNNSQYNLENIALTCTHYDKNNSRVNSKDLNVYGDLSSNETKIIGGFNMGFYSSEIIQTECIVTDLDVMEDL